MHFLITAGPTREYLDPVRFLTNGSTGKMGYACAAAALRRGHRVTLISGPVSISPPKGTEFVPVVSAQDMFRAVNKYFKTCDCVIMTAAVCDYRPDRRERFKITKSDSDHLLKMVRTRDILAHLGNIKNKQILIGFAVQDKSARRKAEDKLRKKNLDAIILNSPSSFGADQTDMRILTAGQTWQSYPGVKKTTIANTIIKLAEIL
jgi:phosphopantothenoylcysteine decarboxylase/phosphopantothenate--cysteine ligase